MFIKDKEATVKVRMNPNCYTHITTDSKNEVSVSGHFDVITKENKKERVWVGDDVWVSPEYAERLIAGERPLARIIATKAVEAPVDIVTAPAIVDAPVTNDVLTSLEK